MKYYLLLFFITTILFCGCTSLNNSNNLSTAYTFKKKLDIRVMGVRRHYFLHVPAGYNPEKKLPLVIVIHGAFSTPRQMEKQSGFSTVSDREGFLVAYPSGAFGIFGFLKHWNAGHCCGKAAKNNIDDVGFLLRVIDDIQNGFNIDTNRIYMVGFSNGGMLAYRFAAEHTDRLAASASLAAALGGRASSEMPLWKTPRPKSPLPIIVFHAKDDPSVPYEGGTSPQKGGEREYISVADSIDFWVKNNRCESKPEVKNLFRNRITKYEWKDNNHGNDIYLYTIDRWGHKWPGKFYTDRLEENDPLKGFSAADVIWDFFKNHSRHIK